MYKCPKGCIETHPYFEREETVNQTVMLGADGHTQDVGPKTIKDRGPVRCARCDARAYWIDTRQLEMFELQPTLA